MTVKKNVIIPETMPQLAKRAPAFTLKNQDDNVVRLSELCKSGYVVLYFYPKDNTPGCTIEANDFNKNKKKFEKLNTVVLGISPDDAHSHQKFINKFSLKFDLLVDTEHKIADKYGVWVEKNMYGRKYWGVQRATFLIAPNNKIAYVWPKVKVAGHVSEVLEKLKELHKQ